MPGPLPEPPNPDRDVLLRALDEAISLEPLGGGELVAALGAWQAGASDISYAQLERNAETYRYRKAVFSGRVLEIRDLPGGSFVRLATRGYDDIIWVEPLRPPSETIVADSRVRVYGYMFGTHSYRSQAGWEITLPQMAAVAVIEERTVRR